MTQPKYKDYRICYEGGNAKVGKKIYELKKMCKCEKCRWRVKFAQGTANCATATTKDVTKIDNVAEFLRNWTCEDGSISLQTAYFKF